MLGTAFIFVPAFLLIGLMSHASASKVSSMGLPLIEQPNTDIKELPMSGELFIYADINGNIKACRDVSPRIQLVGLPEVITLSYRIKTFTAIPENKACMIDNKETLVIAFDSLSFIISALGGDEPDAKLLEIYNDARNILATELLAK